MSKLTVEDTSLVTVADAIRAKSKTTDPMTFPEGFVSAVGGISDNVLPGVVDGSITEITSEMLAGCTKIRRYAFYEYSSLTSIVIPSGVTSINNSTFYNCSSLTSIVIPDGVTSIGGNAFSRCSKLATVELKPTTPPTLNGTIFKNCTALTQIIVPAGTLSAYQSATNWSAYADIMVEASA